ncbi:hypothetical protein K491DRAFT_608412 [Lophiostoma macrostomum CBS 122681]|uniref:DUF1772-domain-containing protein n=1 Tax=Lophiostoma macrostomum CBS 122681 TaxID=1314788 RepID=A0A6A6SW41_9PLEO|nr:hypothetical protein K491DRAFT_608412 [Lophiostoma macrostomum CBS 122681]
MKTATVKRVPRTFGHVLANILSSSYLGAYRYYTLEPIKKIERDQEEIVGGQLINALVEFRRLKEEELSFIAKAATLSAAAVIGIFSWPSTEHTIWVAKMLWNWSFFMSTFSMIGSAPTRLLQHLPEKDNNEKYDERTVKIALNLFLRPVDKSARAGGKMKARKISRSMLWVWQCPAMLMSYSWVLFLIGYALHVLSPVFSPSLGDVSSTV